MQTLFYSILHFLTDGACAFAMFARFESARDFYLQLLLYNFCAFALQFPLGALMDFFSLRQKEGAISEKVDLPLRLTCLSVFVTAIGMFTHPVVLGIGNALFHVGGGIGTIEEDFRKGLKGQALGIFVAPGALGLFLFSELGKREAPWVIVTSVSLLLLMLVCLIGLAHTVVRQRDLEKMTGSDTAKKYSGSNAFKKHTSTDTTEKYNDGLQESGEAPQGLTPAAFTAIFFAFLVVVLRSYAGMAVAFSWKAGFAAGLIAVLAVVLGKMAGGIIASRIGMLPTILISLGLSTVLYLFSGRMVPGVLALFFFNMTMPLTLYLIVKRLRRLPGTSFGLLTLALFIGFLPVYFGASLPLSGSALGAILSAVSLLLLTAADLILAKEEKAHE